MLKPVLKEAGKHTLNTAGLNTAGPNFSRMKAPANYSLLGKKKQRHNLNSWYENDEDSAVLQ